VEKMNYNDVLELVNPLHDGVYVMSCEKLQVGGYAAHRHHRTGRTTALALSYISDAIKNPRQRIMLFDHDVDDPNLDMGGVGIARVVEDIISKLNLREMYISFNDELKEYTVCFGTHGL
jgi:hypothetical protein